MADIQTEVMQVLLKILLDQALIEKSTYDRAMAMLHSAVDLPDFFRQPAWGQEEEGQNGSS